MMVRAVLRVCDLSLGQMLWSRRSIFLVLLVGGPVLLAGLIRVAAATSTFWRFNVNGADVGGAAVFGMMIWLLYVRFIVPVLGVFYGTALIADEVDDKTITYLFTRPIPRRAVLLGKYLAYLACTCLLILPAIVITYLVIVPLGGGSLGQAFPALLADLGMVIAGLAAYGALFALIGARLRRPLVMGLIFALGWEPAVMVFPGYLKRATVAYYVQALVPHAVPSGSGLGGLFQVLQDAPSLPVSLATLGIIVLGALWMAAWAIESREYVLEQ